MSDTTDPNEILWNFLEAMPKTIRTSMYSILGGFLSGFSDPDDDGMHETEFARVRIRQALNAGGYGSVGSTLALTAILDLRFALPRRQIPDLDKAIESQYGSMQLANAHLDQAAAQWRELRENFLSDEAMYEFYWRATTVSEPEPPHRTAS